MCLKSRSQERFFFFAKNHEPPVFHPSRFFSYFGLKPLLMNSDLTTPRTSFDDVNPPKMSTGLNVLTILSIIGCVIQILGSLWGFTTAKKSYDEKEKVLEQMKSDEVPDMAKKMMGSPEDYVELITKNYENRLPILLLSLVAAGLCLYGVIQMRKLRKQGYTFYVIGEILPFLTTALFIGGVAFSGFGFMIGAAIAVIFILLYTAHC